MAARGSAATARALLSGVLRPGGQGPCRLLSTTRMQRLPRQGLPRPPPIGPGSASTSATGLDDAIPIETRQPPPVPKMQHQEDIPWFLQGEEEEVQVTTRSTLGQQRIEDHDRVSLSLPDVPEPLASLHLLLTEGGPSALIARADESEREPIIYVHAKKHSEDAWTDWVVVVEVRSNAGGSVSRVAREIGGFLKYQRPPMVEEAAGEEDEDAVRALSTMQSDEGERIDSIEDLFQEEDITPIKRQERSVSGKNDAKPGVESQKSEKQRAIEERPWKPIRIISREAQDGMRALHESDPEKWNRKELAATFKISVESVRRILKSRWRPNAQVISRQNRRASEREKERKATRHFVSRETEEVQAIRDALRQGNGGHDDDLQEEFDVNEQEFHLQEDDNAEGGEDQHIQPISYEGLVHSGQDIGRGRSGVSRGDGEWALVDAGWCVVHVMTARARNTYDVEGVASRPY